MFSKFFAKNLWIGLTGVIAGTCFITSYYTVDYFNHWSDEQIDEHFLKMAELQAKYISLNSSKNSSNSSDKNSEKKSEGTFISLSQSDIKKEIGKLYDEVFIPGDYYKLPPSVKAFGLLRILLIKRLKIAKIITDKKSDSSLESDTENLFNLEEKILKQLEVIYDHFDKTPESVKKFFSNFLTDFPNSGIRFLDKDIPVPELYLFRKVNVITIDQKYKNYLLKVLSKGESIFKLRELKLLPEQMKQKAQ